MRENGRHENEDLHNTDDERIHEKKRVRNEREREMVGFVSNVGTARSVRIDRLYLQRIKGILSR
jgi:hypothetical protein